MNERLRELWSQAGGSYNIGNQHTWPQYTIDAPEKFAELIVRECAEIAHCNFHVDGVTLGNIMKEHFGVEE
jgi:hypothetical protein